LGSKSKVSEVLNRKRPLSISMIRALHAELGIPAEILLQDPLARTDLEPKSTKHTPNFI
jgi:HTH-type transcriptional regulator/antitoxin HigA